jgi:hypothetical protein
MEVIELAGRSLDVAVMVEFLQTAKKLLAAVAEQRGNVAGT